MNIKKLSPLARRFAEAALYADTENVARRILSDYLPTAIDKGQFQRWMQYEDASFFVLKDEVHERMCLLILALAINDLRIG